jgi:hypothetical protein
MPVREQITLRRRLAVDRLDLMHFRCNTAPVSLSQPYLVTLHNTIQLDSDQRCRGLSGPFLPGIGYERRKLVAAHPARAKEYEGTVADLRRTA